MLGKIKAVSTTMLLVTALSVTTLGTTVQASEIDNTKNVSLESNNRDDVIKSLESKGYLETDPTGMAVKITEKYKQEVIQKVDTNVYNVTFTDNSVEISPRKESRAYSGVTKIVYTWKGFDLYLNDGDASRVAAGLGVAGSLSLLIPDPLVVKILGTALGVSAGLIAYNNADRRGVIIAFIGRPGQNTVPHWITSQ